MGQPTAQHQAERTTEVLLMNLTGQDDYGQRVHYFSFFFLLPHYHELHFPFWILGSVSLSTISFVPEDMWSKIAHLLF